MAEVIRYVDPDATGGGTGLDWTNAFTTLNAFASLDVDLVTAGDWYHCYCRASGNTADTTEVIFLGWTTSAADYILVEAADGDQALKTGWDTSKYRLSVTDAASFVIDLRDDYIRLKGLQIEYIYSSANDAKAIGWGANPSASCYYRIDSCYIRKSGVGGTDLDGIYATQDNTIVDIFNCVVEGFTRNGIGTFAKTVQVFNCMIHDNNVGLYDYLDAGDSFIVKNNAVIGNTTDFDIDNSGVGTVTLDYNASAAGTGANGVTPSGADFANEYPNYATNDYTLINTGNCYQGGADNPSSGLYTVDIEGDTYNSGAYSIGVDEYPAVGGNAMPMAMNLYRRMK